MTVGITGGMGCGKSAVTAMLVTAGFECLDSDKTIREVILKDPLVMDAIRGKFGAIVLREDGSVDRSKLASVVFARDEDRIWLEELTHPCLFQIWRSELQAKPDKLWALEVPLLFEKQLEIWFDFIVCVASSSEQQLARLEQRGIPRPLAEQRISKQLPLAHKIELSDIVLWNDGSISFLQSQVDVMIADLRKRAVRIP
ncbi:MAG: dephospho-CoA kinase [Cephaloticoccus sp.]|nr:dephospho-CoA kinase [Cephaloticoccus sp.]MCF7760228.1 dephospho-CoA kinase [Cephaloticoccus sp.]